MVALVFLVLLFWIIIRILILLVEMAPNEWERIKRKTQGYKRPTISVPAWTRYRSTFFGAGIGVGLIGCIVLGIALKLTLVIAAIFIIGLVFGWLIRRRT